MELHLINLAALLLQKHCRRANKHLSDLPFAIGGRASACADPAHLQRMVKKNDMKQLNVRGLTLDREAATKYARESQRLAASGASETELKTLHASCLHTRSTCRERVSGLYTNLFTR